MVDVKGDDTRHQANKSKKNDSKSKLMMLGTSGMLDQSGVSDQNNTALMLQLEGS